VAPRESDVSGNESQLKVSGSYRSLPERCLQVVG
jgi:hypothetical protein